MISYVKGTLAEVFDDTVVVEAGSVGYGIHVPLTVIAELPHIGEEVLIYTYLKVQEDAFTLYGFLSRRDLEMFRKLISVNGIGPRGALSILSTLSPDELRLAIVAEDEKAISKAPGIGAKTAKRLILDLRESVAADSLPAAGGAAAAAVLKKNSAAEEAMEALVQLGYAPTDAAKAVKAIDGAADMSSEEILRAALRQFRF